jgi:hypothetical protein
LKELEERHLTSHRLQGGKLNVNGTAAKPVIMTGLTTKAAGDWAVSNLW